MEKNVIVEGSVLFPIYEYREEITVPGYKIVKLGNKVSNEPYHIFDIKGPISFCSLEEKKEFEDELSIAFEVISPFGCEVFTFDRFNELNLIFNKGTKTKKRERSRPDNSTSESE